MSDSEPAADRGLGENDPSIRSHANALAALIKNFRGGMTTAEIEGKIGASITRAREHGVGEIDISTRLTSWCDRIHDRRIEYPRQRTALLALRAHLLYRPGNR